MNNPSTPEPQDPWDKLHDADRDEHIERGPSAATVSCIIIGALVTCGFAVYGFYRIACALFDLAP